MAAKMCLVLVTVGLVSGHVYHMPSVRIKGTDDSTCPSGTQLDAVRTQLSKKISDSVRDFSCRGRGWKRVAFLNMSVSDQSTCPDQWRLYVQGSLRTVW